MEKGGRGKGGEGNRKWRERLKGTVGGEGGIVGMLQTWQTKERK